MQKFLLLINSDCTASLLRACWLCVYSVFQYVVPSGCQDWNGRRLSVYSLFLETISLCSWCGLCAVACPNIVKYFTCTYYKLCMQNKAIMLLNQVNLIYGWVFFLFLRQDLWFRLEGRCACISCESRVKSWDACAFSWRVIYTPFFHNKHENDWKHDGKEENCEFIVGRLGFLHLKEERILIMC